MFYADPLIFVQRDKNSELISSITYGENDVDTYYAWYRMLINYQTGSNQTSGNRIIINTSKIDAYVLLLVLRSG